MPILVNSSGTVAALWGSVLVRLPSGALKRVEVGDHVHKGELIVTEADGIIEIAPDGGPATLLKVPTDETVVIGVDRDDMPEAPAAGLTGGSSGSFLEGLRVDRVSESAEQALPEGGRERTPEFEARTFESTNAIGHARESLPESPAASLSGPVPQPEPVPVIEKHPVVMGVSSPTAHEGGNLDFKLTLANTAGASTDVTLKISGATASLKEDTGAVQVSFNGGQTFDAIAVQPDGHAVISVPVDTAVDQVVVRVPTILDGSAEPTETVNVAASTIYNEASSPEGTGSITDAPLVSISGPADVNEGGRSASYVVTLSHVSDVEVTVGYSTADGTVTDTYGPALDGRDYTAVTGGSLTFAPGETSKTISVDLLNDDVYEQAKGFTVNLEGAVGAKVEDGSVLTVIHDDSTEPALDNDQPHVVSVSDETADEGGSLDFHVHLSNSSIAETVIHFVYGDGTATLDTDFGAPVVSFNARADFSADGVTLNADGSFDITVPAGTHADDVIVSVPTLKDGDVEPVESVQLFAATDYDTDYVPGMGAINDVVDGPPTVNISGQLQVSESDGVAFVTIRLSHASDSDVVLSYTTSDGLATAADDYVSDSNVLTFTPGEISKTIPIEIVPDDRDEGPEDFSVNIADVAGASVGVGTVTTTIVEHTVVVDGQTDVLSIDNPKATEGDDLDFHIQLTQDCSADTVMVLLFPGTLDTSMTGEALLGVDSDVVSLSTDGQHFGVIEVDSGSALVTIPAGTLAGQVVLRVHSIDEGVDEGSESLTLLVEASQSSSYAFGSGTINDANAMPTESAPTVNDMGSVANVISDTSADHVMTGTPASDLFVFQLAEAPATSGDAVVKTINGFDMAAPASGGDVLDLRDLLQGENTFGGTGNLDQYLAFDANGPDTVIKVSLSGELVDGHPAPGAATQDIVLAGVDLRSELSMDAAATTAQIIAKMLDQGKLLVDHA
jgi:hypothetical protein